MMKNLLMLFIAALFSILSQPASAQSPFWQPTNGPNDGPVYSVMMDSAGYIFAGSDSGIFRSTDQGTTWRKLPVEAPLTVAFAVNREGFLYACSLNGVLFTADHGVSWLVMNDSLPVASNYPPIFPSFIGIDSADNVFVGLRHAGVYYLPHGSTVWLERNAGLPYPHTSGMAVSPTTGTVVAMVDTSGVFRSTDQGLTWSRHTEGLTDPWVFSITCDPNGKFFISTLGQGTIFRSTDDGMTWNGLGALWVGSITARKGGWLLAGDFNGSAYRSTDDGDSWRRIFDYFPGYQTFAFEITRKNKILLANYDGLYRSTTSDSSWMLVGLPIARTSWMTAHQSGVLFAHAGLKGILYCSSDRGESWVPNSLPSGYIIVELSDGTLLASASGGMYRSTDAGGSWQNIGKPPFSGAGSLLVDSSGTVYASMGAVIQGPPGGIYRSTDGGSSWVQVASPGPNITMLAVNKASHLFAVSGAALFRSRDQGAHWDTLRWATWITALAGAPDGSLLLGAGMSLKRSTDNGDTWETVATFGSTIAVLYIAPDNAICCATANDGVFLRRRQDSVFVAINTGLRRSGVLTLVADHNGFLYAGTASDGVFRSTNPITTVPQVSKELPTAFILEQNYPNPFNPSTTIRYSLPHTSHVTVTLYNSLGQKVAVLVDGTVEAGYHEVTFNAKNLASGIYFYRMEAGDFVQSRKLMLVK